MPHQRRCDREKAYIPYSPGQSLRSFSFSSGNVELLAAVKVSCDAVGMVQIAKDLGYKWEVEVMVHSNAALEANSHNGERQSTTCQDRSPMGTAYVGTGRVWVQEGG